MVRFSMLCYNFLFKLKDATCFFSLLFLFTKQYKKKYFCCLSGCQCLKKLKEEKRQTFAKSLIFQKYKTKFK